MENKPRKVIYSLPQRTDMAIITFTSYTHYLYVIFSSGKLVLKSSFGSLCEASDLAIKTHCVGLIGYFAHTFPPASTTQAVP